jgi:hypothetical protein
VRGGRQAAGMARAWLSQLTSARPPYNAIARGPFAKVSVRCGCSQHVAAACTHQLANPLSAGNALAGALGHRQTLTWVRSCRVQLCASDLAAFERIVPGRVLLDADSLQAYNTGGPAEPGSLVWRWPWLTGCAWPAQTGCGGIRARARWC